MSHTTIRRQRSTPAGQTEEHFHEREVHPTGPTLEEDMQDMSEAVFGEHYEFIN